MQRLPAKYARDACFEHLGLKALYIPYQGEPQPITVLVKQPDQAISFHETRLLTLTHIFEIPADLCPQPLKNGRIQLQDEIFIIQHSEAHDPLRLIWTVEAVKQ